MLRREALARTTLIKEALGSSETTVLTRATRRNITEDTILHSHRRENLKSYTYTKSWTVTEIMSRERCDLLAGPRAVHVSWQVLSNIVLEFGVWWRLTLAVSCICAFFMVRCIAQSAMLRQCLPFMCPYSAWNPKENCDIACEFFSSI
jgi:hypothetical protein